MPPTEDAKTLAAADPAGAEVQTPAELHVVTVGLIACPAILLHVVARLASTLSSAVFDEEDEDDVVELVDAGAAVPVGYGCPDAGFGKHEPPAER